MEKKREVTFQDLPINAQNKILKQIGTTQAQKGTEIDLENAEFSPCGRYIVTQDPLDKTVKICLIDKKEIITEFSTKNRVIMYKWSPNGEYIIMVYNDIINFCSIKDILFSVPISIKSENKIVEISWVPDSEKVITIDNNREVKLYSMKERKEVTF